MQSKRIAEVGVGSNYHTKDNRPISRFNDDRINVEIFPDADNHTSAIVGCPSLGFDSGLRKFGTEQEAIMFATGLYDKLISKMNNALAESVIQRILRNDF